MSTNPVKDGRQQSLERWKWEQVIQFIKTFWTVLVNQMKVDNCLCIDYCIDVASNFSIGDSYPLADCLCTGPMNYYYNTNETAENHKATAKSNL